MTELSVGEDVWCEKIFSLPTVLGWEGGGLSGCTHSHAQDW